MSSDDARQRFKERVRSWREDAISEAVSQLLSKQGCHQLTMDEVAKRVGIAKGSLYLHTAARNDLVTRVLDRWAAGVKKPDSPAAGSYEERRHEICEALFADPKPGRENAKGGTAFPCCLHTSPCPYGWASRWRELAKAYGLTEDESPDDPSPRSTILGEAIQALGSTPSVRELVSQGRPAEAKKIVQRFVSGQEAATTEAPANQRA